MLSGRLAHGTRQWSQFPRFGLESGGSGCTGRGSKGIATKHGMVTGPEESVAPVDGRIAGSLMDKYPFLSHCSDGGSAGRPGFARNWIDLGRCDLGDDAASFSVDEGEAEGT